MKYSKIVPFCLMAIGAALSGWGLFGSLVSVPIAGSIRYTESHFGGSGLAWTITALLLAAAGGCACPGRGQKAGWCCFGLALGLTASSLLAIYRGIMDQLQQIATADEIRSLISGMEVQRGLVALGVGFLLCACGLIWNFWSSDG